MGFPRKVVDAAWARQGGRCAACGKRLTKKNRGLNAPGAWETHHRRPVEKGGSDSLRNCVLLCSTGRNCHLEVGHGGDYHRAVVLSDSDLPFASR